MPISHANPPPKEFLFIDGGYLDKVLEVFSSRFYGGQPLLLDYRQLASGFTKVYYYHCPPPPEREESPAVYELRIIPYIARMQEINQLSGWHVFHGITKRQPKRGNVQKEVDVQIAVDLLTHAFRRNMEKATLLAGDQDFRPVVDAVVREGMFLTVWSEPASASAELRDAADAGRDLDLWALHTLLHNSVVRCAVPERVFNAVTTYEGRTPVAKATTPSQRSFVLSDTGDGSAFQVIAQHKDDGIYYMGYQHASQNFLRTFLDQMHGPLEWEELPPTSPYAASE